MDMSNHNTNPSWLAYFHHQPWRNMPQRILSIACSYYDFFSFNAVVTSLKINPLFKSKVISMRFALLMMSYTSGVCREIYRNRVNYYSVLYFSRTYWPATTIRILGRLEMQFVLRCWNGIWNQYWFEVIRDFQLYSKIFHFNIQAQVFNPSFF